MVLTRRQTSYSSVENDFGGYEQNVNSFPTKPDQFYPDPENRPARGSLSRKRPKKGTIFSRLFQLVQLIVLLLVGAYAYKTSKELEKTNLDMTALNDEYTNLHVTMSETAQELTEAQSMFVSVREKINRISPLPPAKSGRIDIEESRSLFQTILKRHDAQNDRITQLQKNIQGYHQHELEQGFGPGPYHVEMAVEIRGRDHFITIETAPNDLMPHSVHSFMEMVEDKTWDNTLMVAADHIIMATLEGVDGKLKNFDHAQRLVFPEYTDEFPHIANTVGFGGRPGGPEFYFNLDDNRDIHGPGGQPKHALIEEADPCFGKIIHGLDVLEKMMQNNPTLIKHMRILSKEEYMQQN